MENRENRIKKTWGTVIIKRTYGIERTKGTEEIKRTQKHREQRLQRA